MAQISGCAGQDFSGRDHEIDRLGTFALFIRLNLERDALSFGQFLQSGPLHSRDMNEDIAAAGEKREVAIPVRGSRPRIAVQMEPSI